MKPNDFLLNSDFGSLKNDTQSNTISASITAGTIFNPSNPLLASATIDVGTRNAGLRARGKSSKYAPWVSGLTLYSDFNASIPAFPEAGIVTMSLYCSLQRISPTRMRLSLGVEGGSGGPNFKVEENQTITFVFSTFLSPSQ